MTQAATAEERRELPLVSEFFAPGGVLAQAGGMRFEHRPGQQLMALHVEKALAEGSHLIVEAGTGTGKTLAYLYPSLRYAEKSKSRVIVSTGTKSLQEQLFYKDVPFLESMFGDLKISYLKGRSNYLCLQKLVDIKPANVEEMQDLRRVKEWSLSTETGDRAELTSLPESSTLWPKIDARSDGCTGKQCPRNNDCMVRLARERAEQSDIIIINHHLFFTDLALKMNNPEAGILPSADAVIFDEAHELEQIASECFGMTVSDRRFTVFVNDVLRTASLTLSKNRITKAAEELKQRVDTLWSVIPGMLEPGRWVFDTRNTFLRRHKDTYAGVISSLKQLSAALGAEESNDAVAPLIARCKSLYQQFRFIFEDGSQNTVFWIERTQSGGRNLVTAVTATAIDVSPYLKDAVFGSYQTVILASATLAVQEKFDHVRRTLGVEEGDDLLVPSQFDYAKQAILYVPRDMPDPRSNEFFEAAKKQIIELLDISQGRAFCLFTSYQFMQKMYAALNGKIAYPLLLHGTMSRAELLDKFRKTKGAVLFGTSSFWQGIDVQGEQLSCVIIDKLPFGVPSDPIVQSRVKAIEDSGGSGFFDYQVPKAAIALKQGFGRLIRSSSDTGILAMLDPRLQHPSYGKMFIKSLPPYQLTNDIGKVRSFIKDVRTA